MELPNRVAELREERGWSRNSLAKRCGLTHGALRFIERGEVAPTIASRVVIARELELSIDLVFPQEREASYFAQREKETA